MNYAFESLRSVDNDTQNVLRGFGRENELFHMFITHMEYILTSGYLFCRFVRSPALVGHQGLGHIGVSKWREELQEKDRH